MRVEQVDVLAAMAHRGQTDKLGEPYVNHVRAVAAGLRTFAPIIQIAGLLHDIVEDTPWTYEDLLMVGVPEESVRIVKALTKQPDTTRKEQIERVIAGGYGAILVKIADNAHNSHPDRAARLPEETRKRLTGKYKKARQMLWPNAQRQHVEAILTVVNPSLLPELETVRTRR